MPMVEVAQVTKKYDGGFEALKGVDLAIEEGEILALLGPNGAGKTTLISIICGLVTPTGGHIQVGGHDVITDYRETRRLVGLVPQEINLEPFEKVINTVRFSRGLFGLKRDDALIEDVLRRLSLWDKKDTPIRALSGGMKRRVLIAKALAHEPRVLFLDEPTAGVDVELRRDMWEIVAGLKAQGTTIILTTHYIEEAEAIADRIGVINHGSILLVEEKQSLMTRLGRKELRISLDAPLSALPPVLQGRGLDLEEQGHMLVHSYDSTAERSGIARLMADLAAEGIAVRDVSTRQSSLEEIFVSMVHKEESEA
ncbi:MULTISPECIES: ABC transporter ATP-binding protein [unclassified Salipiger]|uniref:ABC transporter ATP-binding protein n=1 Tax=unclassified Salipiger TaxID=2640570 RepID=UPI0013B9E978|nr:MULTISPECIES: ABC transporter ATP-binding protein [unclassified Salipiger]NDV51412.1 ABC transporter ATP-binding protein [Salipiger sp. PrR003]NDW33435.1 ABC transporter ATP-binding protein [Salipiger sp. PrR007]